MKQFGTIEIRTERLRLRRFTIDDAEAMFTNWASDPIATEHVSFVAHANIDVTKTILTSWIEQYDNDGFYNWAIELDGVAIGGISVVRASDANVHAEIGYIIGRPWWGKGIVTEALGAVMDLLFMRVGVHRLYLRHDIANPGSGRVMEKNGMVREGILREHRLRKDGTFGDVAVYGMLQKEWIARKARQ